MDEVTNLAQVKAVAWSDYATAAQEQADSAQQPQLREPLLMVIKRNDGIETGADHCQQMLQQPGH